jgi:hypothetical protein
VLDLRLLTRIAQFSTGISGPMQSIETRPAHGDSRRSIGGLRVRFPDGRGAFLGRFSASYDRSIRAIGRFEHSVHLEGVDEPGQDRESLRLPGRTVGVLLLVSTLALYCFCLNGLWDTDHTVSFLQLDYAILANHSFVLAKGSSFQPGTVDDFIYNGNWYSALAPGTAILALPFAALGFALNGGQYTSFGPVMMTTEFFVALLNSLAVYLLYKIARLFFTTRTSVVLASVYAFSTISWPLATYFFQSDVSAFFVLLGAYSALRVGRGLGRWPTAAVCGLAIAVAMVVDYVDAVLIPIFFLYLFLSKGWKGGRHWKTGFAFLLVSMAGIVLVGLYDLALFGQFFVTTEQAYSNSSLAGLFSFPVYLGIGLNLFSPLRGLFLYTPFLLLGVLGICLISWRPPKSEWLFLIAIFLGILIPYSAWHEPTGGVSFGPRLIVSAVPFLILPSGVVLETAERKLLLVSWVLYAIGVFVNGVGALTTAIPPEQNPRASPLLETVLPQFFSGGLDTWWIGSVGEWWPLISGLVILAAGLAPYLIVRLSRGSGSDSPPSSNVGEDETVFFKPSTGPMTK